MPETNRKRRRTFSAEFKSQIIQLYQNGKRKCDIINEYDIAPSLLDKWVPGHLKKKITVLMKSKN